VTTEEAFDLAVPQLRSFAGDVLEGADVGWEQVEAIRTRLVDTGAYDSRAASSSGRPGHSIGRLAEFVNDPERLAGFEEQYAAVAGLLARSAGLPARVVVGFTLTPEEIVERSVGNTVSVLADDIAAWIEVRFNGIGWLPFDVTPPRDREPEDSPIGRTEREVAVPNPPPEPPPPVLPPDLDLEASDEEVTEEPPEVEAAGGPGFPWGRVAVGAAVTFPIVAIAGAMLAVVMLKRRRTRRRRGASTPARRVAGAWHEVVDRLSERGTLLPRAATNREIAFGLAEEGLIDAEHGGRLVDLADDVDLAVFHPDPPTEAVAEHAWFCSDELCSAVAAGQSRIARMRAALDPRPLLTKDPLAEEDDRRD
jgi:hypothetical protein